MASDSKDSGGSEKPYDISLKSLIGDKPEDWLPLFDLPSDARLTELDADVSGVTLAADRLFRVETGGDVYGLHAELESGHTGNELPRRLYEYSVLAQMKHKILFRSFAVLLTKGANSPAITGTYEQRLPDGTLISAFYYDVIKVYEIPAEELLTGNLSLVPLAPLGALPIAELAAVVSRMGARIQREAVDDVQRRKLLGASWLLMSARYKSQVTEQLLRGAIEKMVNLLDFPYGKETVELFERVLIEKTLAEGTAKGLAEGQAKGLAEGQAKGLAEGEVKGKAKGVRQTVLTLGATRYGEPNDAVRAALEAVSDYDRLQQIAARLFVAQSWDELIAPGV